MKSLKILFCSLVALCGVTATSAQVVGIKWGLLAGVNVPDYSFQDKAVDLKNKAGWQLGMITSIKLGFLTIDPQLLYIRQQVEVGLPKEVTGDLKTQSLDLPVMVGATLVGPLRIFAGPVFTLMNKCDNDLPFADQRDFDITNLRSTLSYAAGVELRFKKARFDLRYNGQFKDKKGVALTEQLIGKMRSQSVSLNVGYYF